VEASLNDQGSQVLSFSSSLNVEKGKQPVSFSDSLVNVKTWSAETPLLYELIITLKSAEGNIIEVLKQDVGFRTIEIKDGVLLVNGQPPC